MSTLPNSEKMEIFLYLTHKTYLLSQLLSVQWLHFYIIFFFSTWWQTEPQQIFIAVRIWEKRSLWTKGVKGDFVEVMRFELDF